MTMALSHSVQPNTVMASVWGAPIFLGLMMLCSDNKQIPELIVTYGEMVITVSSKLQVSSAN